MQKAFSTLEALKMQHKNTFMIGAGSNQPPMEFAFIIYFTCECVCALFYPLYVLLIVEQEKLYPLVSNTVSSLPFSPFRLLMLRNRRRKFNLTLSPGCVPLCGRREQH